MNSPRHQTNEEGMALVLSLIFLIAMAIMVGSLVSRTHSQANQVMNYIEYDHTLQAMEAGIAIAHAELNGDRGSGSLDTDGLVGVDPLYDLSSSLPSFGEEYVTPLEFESMANAEFFAVSYNWGSDNIDNNGDGDIDEDEEADFFSVYSSARTPTATRRGEVILSGIIINIWRNAVFAGAGQTTGTLINGNVSIHGSVHILGDNLGEGDLAVAALDLSGTSLIHNNYDGMPAALRGRVPNPPTTEVAGETVETLDATLRVRNGLVGLSGNSEIGQPQATGNTYKETMDGVFVADGWTGNGLDADGNPINVHSDNGYDADYDLGSAFDLPTYDDDGGRDHLAYYLETDPDPTQGFQQVKVGDMAIEADRNYYWNATLGVEVDNQALGVAGMPNVAGLNPNHNYIWFDAATNTMMVNGRIAVDGDVTIDRGSGNDKTITYTGKGSILTYDADSSGNGGDVTIETDLITMNADGTTANSFPNNVLAFMAENDTYLGINSQLELMGAFYAQDEVILDKQSTIIGTIVGSSFNMGGQVPDIYQVPTLLDGFNDGMRVIGTMEVRYYKQHSWRELGVL